MCARQSVIPILAVCHRDVVAAKRWLKWASFLAGQPGGNICKENIVVFVTKRVAETGHIQFMDEILTPEKFFKVVYVVCPDEEERGYPYSANHLFLRTLEYAEKNWPNMDPLFIEPDCPPVEPDWYYAIQKEYVECGKKFMGFLTEGGHPHMSGNAVYDRNWRTSAPSIATVLERKDSGGMFPAGLGFPFDLWIANDVLKDFHQCATIWQVWAPGRWTEDNLHRIQPGAVLVHQDKTGTLIFTIARQKYPDFLKHMPEPRMYFMLQNPSPKVTVHGSTFEFTPCSRAPDGAWWSVLRPDSPEDEEALASAAGRFGISSITEADYKNLLSQRKPHR